MNDSIDLQRTPQYTQPRRDIPVPEKDVLDPVAEYNRGELAAMNDIENLDFGAARLTAWYLIDDVYDRNPNYVQGYVECLDLIASRETAL